MERINMIVKIDKRFNDPKFLASWAKFLKVSKIIIGSDKISYLEESIIKSALDIDIKIVKINNLEKFFLNEDRESAFLIVEKVKDLYPLKGLDLDVSMIDLGQIDFTKGCKPFSEDCYLGDEDMKFFRQMTKEGKDIFIQDNPYSTKKNISMFFSKI